MGNPNFEVWKEPRGFIKLLEIFLSIFAFACVTGFRGGFSFLQNLSGSSHPVSGSFKYPFSSPITLYMQNNKTFTEVQVLLNQRHSTEFFVVIGVFCFLFCIGMLVYYIWFEDEQAKMQAKAPGVPVSFLSGPVIDFSMSVFWAFFWFVSSIAIAVAVKGIKHSTSVKSIIASLALCSDPYQCEIKSPGKYATLTVSILLGFLNVFVWCGNVWFLWKETPWHKEPQKTTHVPDIQHQQIPPAAI